MTLAADSSVQQQSKDDELIKAIDIWQLVDQGALRDMPPAAAEPAQKTVGIETQPSVAEKITQQTAPPAAALASKQQNNAEPVQEAVIMEAQAPVEEKPSKKPAASESRRQNSSTPAQDAAPSSSWPVQEIVIIDAPASVEEQPSEKNAAAEPSPPKPASPAAVPDGQQNSGAPAAQGAALQPVRQDAGWPVPELPQSLSPSASAAPDDIVAAVEEALRQYKNKDFPSAVSNLDYAAHLIRQKKVELLKELLPEPFYGWQAKAPESQSLGTAVFGGGSTVSRDYHTQSGEAVSIEIVSDSPVLQSIIMMLNNPLFAGASGGNLKTIKRQRAMIKYNEEERSGEINIVVASRFIVTVKGRGVDLTWLLRYAEAMDFDALAEN